MDVSIKSAKIFLECFLNKNCFLRKGERVAFCFDYNKSSAGETALLFRIFAAVQ